MWGGGLAKLIGHIHILLKNYYLLDGCQQYSKKVYQVPWKYTKYMEIQFKYSILKLKKQSIF